MNADVFFQKLIHKKFAALRTKNPSYSLRAFARDLKMSPATVSQVLAGKRTVSFKTALSVASKIGLDPAEIKNLETLFSSVDSGANKVEFDGQAFNDSHSFYRQLLTEDEQDIVSNWKCYATLSLAETLGFEGTDQYVAKCLGLERSEARQILTRLEKIGLMQRQSDGTFLHLKKNVTTSDGVSNTALRERHKENLQAARHAIENCEIKHRDLSFVTVAVDPDRIPEAKRRIRAFLNELSDFLEGENPQEVYEFCTVLFPRTIGGKS